MLILRRQLSPANPLSFTFGDLNNWDYFYFSDNPAITNGGSWIKTGTDSCSFRRGDTLVAQKVNVSPSTPVVRTSAPLPVTRITDAFDLTP